jgi:hypothetical protein
VEILDSSLKNQQRAFLKLVGFAFIVTVAPLQALENRKMETFNCGRLGTVTMRSTPKITMAAGQVTYQS